MTVEDVEIEELETTPERFPMSLEEYAVNVGLDPMLEAALAVWISNADRLQTEWDSLLAAYRVLPIR